jgi:GMP synthase-like glutamine amidotransferase
MRPVRIFRHQSWVGPGRTLETLTQLDLPFEIVAIDRGDRVPTTVDDVSAMVFLGGTMSVNDPLPWIEQELSLIREGQARGVPMLGHCLGSQLISRALGGTVAPMPAKEIGWYKVARSRSPVADAWFAGCPDEFEILIWHHDAFTLPQGAVPLYSSKFCADQAFVLGNTLATVAHIEVTAPLLHEWVTVYGDDIHPESPSIQRPEQILHRLDERVQRMHATVTDRLYTYWLARIREAERQWEGGSDAEPDYRRGDLKPAVASQS